MKLKAVNNFIIVRVDIPEEKEHASGLTLTAQRQEKPCYGIITSVGPDCQVPTFHEGVHVLIPPSGVGIEYRIGQDVYYLFLDHEIYGIIND